MNAVAVERCAEAMPMLVSRSSPAPAGRSEIFRCRGDLATRYHHERGTAWAHPSNGRSDRDAALGQGRQTEDRRRRPAAAVPEHVERSEHARPSVPEGKVRHDDLRRGVGQGIHGLRLGGLKVECQLVLDRFLHR